MADSDSYRPRPLTPPPARGGSGIFGPRLDPDPGIRGAMDQLRFSDGSEAYEASREDDLLYWMHRGANLLDAKEPNEARTALERAFQVSPENPKVRNLLGLAYFKLGLLEAAKAIYDRLVEEYPEEAPLAVNLGLVLLRQGRLADAEAALKRALAMAPDHSRAHCYLGLVLYRRGDLAKARDHFLRGQAEDFARRVGEKLSRLDQGRTAGTDLLREVAESGVHDLDASAIPFRALDPAKDGQVLRDEGAWQEMVVHHQESDGPSVDLDVQSLLPVWRVSAPPAPLPPPPPRELPVESPLEVGQVLESVNEELELPIPDLDELPPIATDEPASTDLPRALQFTASEEATKDPFIDGRVAVQSEEAPGFYAGPGRRGRLVLRGVGHLRRSAMVAASGGIQIAPESSRLQGRVLGAFGAASDPMCRLEGTAVVFIAVPALAVALRGVRDLNVVQSALWGFDAGFNWDNGRVLGMDVVTLNGTGSLLLSTEGTPMLLPVDAEMPVQSAKDSLIAWSEGVRLSPLEGSEERLFRLHGRGYVLVAFPGDVAANGRADRARERGERGPAESS